MPRFRTAFGGWDGSPRSRDSESRFAAYVEGLVSVIGHADRAEPMRDYCVGLLMPCERKSVEPMAAVTAPARVAAQHQSLLHFVGEGRLVGREGFGEGARDGFAGRWSARADRGVDHRRHRLSQAGAAFGRRGAAILRPARQAGQLPGRGVAVDCQSRMRACRWPIGCICRKTGRRTANVGARRACPRRSVFKTKPRDRARADPLGLRGRPAARRRAAGRWLWQQQRSARGDHGAGLELRGRHSAEDHGVGARHGAAAAEEVVGPRAATEAHAPRRASIGRSPSRSSRSACQSALGERSNGVKARPSTLSSRFARVRVRVAHRDYWRTDSRPEEWLLIEWPKGENEPTKYWLSTLPERHRLPRSGRHRQTALAHRARLSGAQAGGRARAFRRARLARLPPPRHTVHRSLRIPDLREGDDSPLRTSFRHAAPGTCRTRPLPTQRIRHCGLNATSRTRSRPCADD